MARLAHTSCALLLTAPLCACTVVGSLDEFQAGPAVNANCVRPAAGDYSADANGVMDLIVHFDSGTGGAGGNGSVGGSGGGAPPANWEVHQDIDPQITTRIAHTPGCCWDFHIAYNADRNDVVSYCREPDGRVVRKGNTQHQEWDLPVVGRQPNDSDISCESGDVYRPGMTTDDPAWTHLCAGTISRNPNGNYFHNTEWKYVGADTLQIGGEDVEAYRFEEDTTYQGTSNGKQTATHWYTVTDLRWVKSDTVVDISSPSVLGDVDFDEDSHWTATR